MEIRLETQGLRELEAQMRQLPALLDRRILDAGLLAGARLVRDEAKQLAPELSVEDPRWERGALKRAIAATRIRPQQYASEVIVRVRKLTKKQLGLFSRRRFAGGRLRRADPRDAFYWMFVEFGTAKMRAQPFLRPAFEAKKEQAVQKAIDAIRDRVQRELQKHARSLDGFVAGLN